jgi:hypothetical protein
MSFTTWEQAEASFDEILDTEGPVKIAGLEFDPSRVLRVMNANDYRSLLFDFVDAMGVDSDDLEGYLSA